MYLDDFIRKHKGELEKNLLSEMWIHIKIPPIISSTVAFINNPEYECLNIIDGEADELLCDSRKYKCSGTMVWFIQCLYDYLILHSSLPSSTLKISNGVIELLALYNNLSHSILLEAKASTQTLKSITVGHLSLNLISLDFLVREIKYFVARIDLKSSEKTKSAEWNTTKSELLNHKIEIQKKVCDIVCTRINEEFNKIFASDYTQIHETPSEMIGSIRSTLMQLYNQLNKYLDREDINSIFLLICSNLASKIRECTKITNGRTKLIEDLNCLSKDMVTLQLKENFDKVCDAIKFIDSNI